MMSIYEVAKKYYTPLDSYLFESGGQLYYIISCSFIKVQEFVQL